MNNRLIAAITLTFTPVLAVADSPQQKPEELIVTATRTEQSYASTLASVTVFAREDIEQLQVQSVPEILAKAAGISVNRNGGRGASSSISLRGNQADHTLFLIDGVRVGSATLGTTPIELIDPELIERIEIVRGPKSSLYGSDALGGVINIITRKADAHRPLQIKMAIGNNDTQEGSMSLSHTGEKLSASLTGSFIRTDGFDNTESNAAPHQDDDGLEQNAVAADLSYRASSTITLGANLQYTDSETEYDTNCTDATTFIAVICSPYSENDNSVAQLYADWQALSWWKVHLSTAQSESNSKEYAREIDINTTFSSGEFDTEKYDTNWQNDFTLGEHTLLSLGYDYLTEKVSGSTAYDVSERDNQAVYTQVLYENGNFSANLGARNDDNEQFGSHDTYNLTLGYALTQSLKLIASYGEAFKAPTFNDLYYPNFGDPSLVPEESDAYELGIQGTHDHINWSLRTYKNNIENLIQYNAAIFANDQIASATIEGVEFTGGLTLNEWRANLALTWLDTEDDVTGNELARRPQEVINLDVDRRFGAWSFGATFYAASSRYNDTANTQELPGYGTIGIRGSYTPNDQWSFRLKADNLLEKDYVISRDFSLGDYQQPGLEVLLSVIYTPSF